MPTDRPAGRPEPVDVRAFLRYYAYVQRARRREVRVFQVGANDGRTNDPINPYVRRFGWSGLLVEPQVDVFQHELTATYSGYPTIRLANVALASDDGAVMPFYRIKFSKARWATGLAGFSRGNIEAHVENGYVARKAADEGLIPPEDVEDVIEQIDVPTRTPESLLAEHDLEQFEVLCIDTEGYDWEVLRLIDLERYRTQVVVFESKNLAAGDYADALARLRAQGYWLGSDDGDTLAARLPFPRLARVAVEAERRARVPLGRWKRRFTAA